MFDPYVSLVIMTLNITACLEFVMYSLSGWFLVTICTIDFRVCHFLKHRHWCIITSICTSSHKKKTAAMVQK